MVAIPAAVKANVQRCVARHQACLTELARFGGIDIELRRQQRLTEELESDLAKQMKDLDGVKKEAAKTYHSIQNFSHLSFQSAKAGLLGNKASKLSELQQTYHKLFEKQQALERSIDVKEEVLAEAVAIRTNLAERVAERDRLLQQLEDIYVEIFGPPGSYPELELEDSLKREYVGLKNQLASRESDLKKHVEALNLLRQGGLALTQTIRYVTQAQMELAYGYSQSEMYFSARKCCQESEQKLSEAMKMAQLKDFTARDVRNIGEYVILANSTELTEIATRAASAFTHLHSVTVPELKKRVTDLRPVLLHVQQNLTDERCRIIDEIILEDATGFESQHDSHDSLSPPYEEELPAYEMPPGFDEIVL